MKKFILYSVLFGLLMGLMGYSAHGQNKKLKAMMKTKKTNKPYVARMKGEYKGMKQIGLGYTHKTDGYAADLYFDYFQSKQLVLEGTVGYSKITQHEASVVRIPLFLGAKYDFVKVSKKLKMAVGLGFASDYQYLEGIESEKNHDKFIYGAAGLFEARYLFSQKLSFALRVMQKLYFNEKVVSGGEEEPTEEMLGMFDPSVVLRFSF